MSKEYRYEIKFVLDELGLAKSKEWLYSSTSAVKAFNKRVVNSIYFDDLNYSAVKDNLSGISERKKLRLRWYGTQNCSKATFEVKMRNGRIGSKSQYQIKFPENSFFNLSFGDITSLCISDLSAQNLIFDEYIFPSLYVSYTREYYETQTGIRITLDQDINFSDTQLNSTLTDNSLIPYPRKIMEIKCDLNKKDEVSNLIRPLHMTPKRHSKYLIGLASLGQVVYI